MTLDNQGLCGSFAFGLLGAAFHNPVLAMAFCFVAIVVWRAVFALMWEARGDRA